MSTRLNDIAGELENRAHELREEYSDREDLAHVPLELFVIAKRIREDASWADAAVRVIGALQIAATEELNRRGCYPYIGQNTRDAAMAVLEKYRSSDMSDEELLQQPDYLLARGVTMHIAAANMRGLEVAVFEDEGDVKPHSDVATDVYLFTMVRPPRTDFKGNPRPAESIDFRVIVRHFRHVAIQCRVGDRWESPTFFSLEMPADAILAVVIQKIRTTPWARMQPPTLSDRARVVTYQLTPWNLR